jgi:hypothetical protein
MQPKMKQNKKKTQNYFAIFKIKKIVEILTISQETQKLKFYFHIFQIFKLKFQLP